MKPCIENASRPWSLATATLAVVLLAAAPAAGKQAPATAPATPPATAAAPDAAPPLALDAPAVRTITQWMASLEGQLSGALAGHDKAQAALTALALKPKDFEGELQRFVAGAREQKAAKGARLSGIEMRVTLWLGIVPIHDLQLYVWRTAGELRMLKLNVLPAQQGMFTGARTARWDDPVGQAFGRLAEQLVEAAAEDRCGSIPLVTRADYEPFLPSEEIPHKAMVSHFERFRYAFVGACNRLRGVPYNHVTWQLGQLGAATVDAEEQAHTFRLQLVASRGDERRPALLHITPPVAPPSSKGKRHVRVNPKAPEAAPPKTR